MKEETYCINCFTEYHIREFIKENGQKVDNENYICSFCNNNDPFHDEKYEILSFHTKKNIGLIAEETYTISKDILNRKIIELINKYYEFDDSEGNDNINLIKVCSILFPLKFGRIQLDTLHRVAEKDFIKYREFPLKESEKKTYYDNNPKSYTSRYYSRDVNYWKPKYGISWNSIKEHTKHKARFFDHKNQKNSFQLRKELENFIPIFESLVSESQKEPIFRSRIANGELIEKLKNSSEQDRAKELGKAPVKIVKNNRFSPIGISYGYYAYEEKTAILEIRAEVGDKVAIGEFELKENLKVVNFTKEYIKSIELFKKVGNPFKDTFNILFSNSLYSIRDSVSSFTSDISKPIRSSDSVLEYVPTQIMAEFIWSLGYDGFIFDSSPNENGKNIVLFENEPEYKNYKIVELTKKNIEYKEDSLNDLKN